MGRRILALVLSLLGWTVFLGAQPQPGSFEQTWEKGPAWLRDAVIYQVYPSSFKDSDGNGIGDIPGVLSMLDYIESLGVTAVWFNPLFESGWVDGGYDVIDYYRVDPRFGTNNDLVQLIDACHARGIKVLLDLVPGHTSNQHPWFAQSAEDSNLQYSDYYIWSDRLPDQKAARDLEAMLQSPDPMQNTRGKWMVSDAPRGHYYYKNFYACQPALNFGFAHPDPAHPWEQRVDAPGPRAVKQELKDIMAFWFSKGVDGFRVDMADSLVKNDPDKAETIRLWREMRAWLDANYPERVLLAEWNDPKFCLAAGFHMDMYINRTVMSNRRMYFDRKHQADGGSYFSLDGCTPSTHDLYGNPWPEDKVDRTVTAAGVLKEYYDYWSDVQSWTRDWGYFAQITGNHDHLRLNTGARNNPDQLRVMLSWILTTPLPILYYGDEIGMRSLVDMPNVEGANHNGKERAGARTPMQWDGSVNAGFSTCAPEKLYLPVCPEWTSASSYPAYLAWKKAGAKHPTAPGAPTVASQETDPQSLLNWTRKLIALRKNTPAFWADSDLSPVFDPAHPYPMVYTRSDGNQTWLVALNPTGKKRSVSLSSVSGLKGRGVVTPELAYGKVSLKGEKLSMGPTSIFIARLPESESAVTVCSFNIRYANNKDKYPDGSSAAWVDRREAVKRFMDSVKPDIVGLQEVRKAQSEDFYTFFGDAYGYYDVGRDSETGASVAEANCEGVGILYRKDRFELVRKGFFWLDANPDARPAQNTDKRYGEWRSACRRVTVYTVLKDKKHGGSTLCFYSTHFDHVSEEAMRLSSALMAQKMKEISRADVVVAVGDLNTTLEAGLMEALQDDFLYARTEAPGADLYTGTFNGFGHANKLIDHIFYQGAVAPVKYWVDKTGYGVPFLSDHYPLLFRFDYK